MQTVKLQTSGNNILDKVFANISRFYASSIVVAPIGLSDHNSIVMSPLKPHHSPSSRETRLVRDARPSHRRQVSQKLYQVNWSTLLHLQSSDDQLAYFNSTLASIISSCIPVKKSKCCQMTKLGLLWRLSLSFRKDNPHGLDEISPSLDLIETILIAYVRKRVIQIYKYK